MFLNNVATLLVGATLLDLAWFGFDGPTLLDLLVFGGPTLLDLLLFDGLTLLDLVILLYGRAE